MHQSQKPEVRRRCDWDNLTRPKLFAAQRSRPSDGHTSLRIQQTLMEIQACEFNKWPTLTGEKQENTMTQHGLVTQLLVIQPAVKVARVVLLPHLERDNVVYWKTKRKIQNDLHLSYRFPPFFCLASWISMLNFLQNPLVHFPFLLPPSSSTLSGPASLAPPWLCQPPLNDPWDWPTCYLFFLVLNSHI